MCTTSEDDRVRKPAGPWKVSDLDLIVNREVTLDPRDHPTREFTDVIVSETKKYFCLPMCLNGNLEIKQNL